MPDLHPFSMGSLYGIAWLVVARLAVAIRRVARRDRASRENVMRLWRWRDC